MFLCFTPEMANAITVIFQQNDGEDDSAYYSPNDSPNSMYVTIDGDPADDHRVPRWLK